MATLRKIQMAAYRPPTSQEEFFDKLLSKRPTETDFQQTKYYIEAA